MSKVARGGHGTPRAIAGGCSSYVRHSGLTNEHWGRDGDKEVAGAEQKQRDKAEQKWGHELCSNDGSDIWVALSDDPAAFAEVTDAELVKTGAGANGDDLVANTERRLSHARRHHA